MNDDRGDRRSETAKRTDDSAIIDDSARGPDFGGSSGGNLHRDVGSQAQEDRVRDPEPSERVTKTDKLDHAQGSVEPRTPDSNG